MPLTDFFDVIYDRCQSCIANRRPRCYHWSVGDETSIALFQRQLEEQLNIYLSNCGKTYEEIKRATKISYNSNNVNRAGDINNIDFNANGATEQERIQALSYFSSLLTSELRLRKLPLHGTLEERRNRLRGFLKVEQQLELIVQAIS
jgi:hypothetical protein